MLERHELTKSELGELLCLAVKARSLQSAELLLLQGVDASSCDSDGQGALHCASTIGVAAFIPLLMRSGADLRQRNRPPDTFF